MRTQALRKNVCAADHESAQGRKSLSISKDAFTPARLREELRQPGDGRHEFDAYADESGRSKQQQDRQGGRQSRRQCGKSVDENAPGQYASSTEQIGQVTAQ